MMKPTHLILLFLLYSLLFSFHRWLYTAITISNLKMDEIWIRDEGNERLEAKRLQAMHEKAEESRALEGRARPTTQKTLGDITNIVNQRETLKAERRNQDLLEASKKSKPRQQQFQSKLKRELEEGSANIRKIKDMALKRQETARSKGSSVSKRAVFARNRRPLQPNPAQDGLRRSNNESEDQLHSR